MLWYVQLLHVVSDLGEGGSKGMLWSYDSLVNSVSSLSDSES